MMRTHEIHCFEGGGTKLLNEPVLSYQYIYIQLFSCVREFLASQTLNNDLTVWKYQQTLQLQSTENCMKLTFYEYRTKHT